MKYLEINFNKVSARLAYWKLQKLLLTIIEDLNKWRWTIYYTMFMDRNSQYFKWLEIFFYKRPKNKYFMFASLWHSFFLPLKHESSDRKYMCVWVLSWSVVSDSCDPIDCSLLDSCVHGIFRQEYWSGLPFPSPGDLPDPGIEPRSPALQADALPSEPPGKKERQC